MDVRIIFIALIIKVKVWCKGPVACLHAVDLLYQGPYHTGFDHHALVR